MATSVSHMTTYRRAHPEYYEAEKVKRIAYVTTKYHTDADYRQKMLDYKKERRNDPEVKKAYNAYMRELYHRKKLERASEKTESAGD